MNKISDPQYGDNFVGRGEKINELKEKIENNGIVVITGDRGIGKTNLMLVAMEELKKEKKECHHISKGSIFYDRMSEIFKHSWFSKLRGVQIPPGVGVNWDPGKSPLLQDMVNSKERIIFVEDAQMSDEKAIDLIFDASCRNERLRYLLEIATPYKPAEKLGGRHYGHFEVKRLSDKDTAELLKGLCLGLSDGTVKRIVSLSKGYPAVARALAYICDNKNTDKEIFAFLGTLKDDDMEHNLNQSHKEVLNTLNGDSQKVIKILAIATATLTLNLITAFCGEKVGTQVNDFIERGILVKSEEKFYRIYHPLFREYLRNIQPIALEDKSELYRKAMEKVKSKFDSLYILLEVLNEPASFEELIKQTESYKVINSVGTQGYILGELEQAFFAWNHLLEKTKGVDKGWESIATGNIGNYYLTKGELEKALEYYKKALELEQDEELRRKEGIAKQLGNIGNIYRIKGELEKALKYHEKALKLNEELGRKEGIAADYGNIGIVYKTKGERDKALGYHKKALGVYVRLGRKEGMATAYGNIGIGYFTKGELDKALENFEKALKLVEELGIKEGIARQLGNLGIVYFTEGELDKALENFEKALKLVEALGIKEGIAKQLENIGSVYSRKGELDKALENFEKALGIFKDMDSRIDKAQTLMDIGDVYVQKGEKERALDCYSEAKDLAKGSSIFEDVNKRIINIRSK
jgi:tetratricopeptide (TPR) repeat protein